MVDSNVNTHNHYNTAWTSGFHPRSSAWGAGLPVKNGFSGETQLPPIVLNGPPEGAGVMEHGAGSYGQQWGNVNERSIDVVISHHDENYGYSGI